MDFLSRLSLHARCGPVCAAWRVALLVLLLCGTVALGALRLSAQSAEPTEYQVKAAFLFNFAKFVEWPDVTAADTKRPVILGVLGDDPFGSDLASIIVGQVIRGHPIQIRKYRYGDDLRHCDVLFISASEQSHLPQILASLGGASALTVSDIDGFAEAGGVMQFVMEDSRVHFVVNLAAAEKARLRISSKLLALARVLDRAEGGQSR
jgi:hypothetical protein